MIRLSQKGVLISAGLCLGAAEPPKIDHLLVLDLKASGVEEVLTANLSEVLLAAIREAAPEMRVVGQSEVQSMLVAEQQKMFLGCDTDTSCLAEIGGAIGADHLFTGTLGKVGNLYLINLKLIDTQRAVVAAHASRRLSGSVEGLVDAIAQMAAEIIGGRAPAGTPPEATTAPATPPPVAPEAPPQTDLPVDSATIQPPTTAVSGEVPPPEEPTPWYGSWWFWTITGVVVAGGVATGVAIGVTQGGGGGGGPETTGGTLFVEVSP